MSGFLQAARKVDDDADRLQIVALLRELFPLSTDVWRTAESDRRGVDYWVADGVHSHGVDLKLRYHAGRHDYALETWSDVERATVGWTLDPHKITDFILWYWVPTDRHALVPFEPLRQVFTLNKVDWAVKYGTHRQDERHGNDTWVSECVFVPIKVVWAAIYKRFAEREL